jgi:hypothetical protein
VTGGDELKSRDYLPVGGLILLVIAMFYSGMFMHGD